MTGMHAEGSLVCLERTHHSGFRNQDLSALGFYLQTSEYCMARSWQSGWGDLFSMSLQLSLLPEGLSASVLGPSGDGGEWLVFMLLGTSKQTSTLWCQCQVSKPTEEEFFQGDRAALGEG